MTTKSVREKLAAGDYKNSQPYPQRTESFKERRRLYNEETQRLLEFFKQDLLKELELDGHPKANLLWNHAWDLGHASGLHEVLTYAEDLADLLC